jgi:putative PIN family toxin of toxin-antitoxin system
MRLVLDTNTVVSALLWHGLPYQLFTRSRAFSLAFFSSPTLLTELEEVLAYPRLAKAVTASGLAPAQLLQRYLRLATVVQPAPIAPTFQRGRRAHAAGGHLNIARIMRAASLTTWRQPRCA